MLVQGTIYIIFYTYIILYVLNYKMDTLVLIKSNNIAMMFYSFLNYFIDQFQITFVPEDEIVTISEANSEDDLISLQRALPPTTEESMALAIESPPLLNSMLLNLITLTIVISFLSMLCILYCRKICTYSAFFYVNHIKKGTNFI